MSWTVQGNTKRPVLCKATRDIEEMTSNHNDSPKEATRCDHQALDNDQEHCVSDNGGNNSYENREKCLTDERNTDEVMVVENGTVEAEEASAEKTDSPSRRVLMVLLRLTILVAMLYFFICSLNLLSSAFTLIGGRATGAAFQSSVLSNPICGLMIGVVATAILQSSSTSTSIVITMVASNLLTVPVSIPIIMGANIGTSVTGIIVSVTQASDREVFRRAFAAATVHDMFNWMSVLILLPLEVATGYLYRLTTAIVESTNLTGGGQKHEFLSVITRPFTDLIIQLDKGVLGEIAAGFPEAQNKSLLRYWCSYDEVNASDAQAIVEQNVTENYTLPPVWPTQKIGIEECVYIFQGTSLSEQAVGWLLLIMSLVLMIACLIVMVKVLKTLLQGHMAKVIQKSINADFPGRAAFLTGYVALVTGAVITVLVQSSSVVASALTPLAGLSLVTIERVYPMMLGANLGTTSTAILASFAATGNKVSASFQIALCHLFFNLSGILIWYPVPYMRKAPIGVAKFLGRTTAEYRWFAFVYLVIMFFLLPLLVFGLSLLGWQACVAVGVPFAVLVLSIAVINILQRYRKKWLPRSMQTWDFLPPQLRSLQPIDSMVTRVTSRCNCWAKKEDVDSERDEESGTNGDFLYKEDIKAKSNEYDSQHPLLIEPATTKKSDLLK